MSSPLDRIPVRLPSWEELNRRVSVTVNYLLDRQPTRGVLYNLDNPAYTYTAGSPSNLITGYAGDIGSLYADADATTGTITVTEEGIYEVSGFVTFTGGTNQDSYGLEIIQTFDQSPAYTTIAVTEWGSKTVAASLSGTLTTILGAGDVIAMGAYEATTTGTIALTKGQLTIEQVI